MHPVYYTTSESHCEVEFESELQTKSFSEASNLSQSPSLDSSPKLWYFKHVAKIMQFFISLRSVQIPEAVNLSNTKSNYGKGFIDFRPSL